MKPHARRAIGATVYYKLATWDAVRMTWRDGRHQYETENAAVAAAHDAGPGRYRISMVDGRTRRDGVPFTVPE